MNLMQPTRAPRGPRRSLVPPIVLALLAAVMAGGCDAGRGRAVDLSSDSAQARESRRVISRRAQPESKAIDTGDEIVQLASATAREADADVRRAARNREEALSLGTRTERSREASSAEKLGVLERYLKRSNAPRPAESSRRVETIRRRQPDDSSSLVDSVDEIAGESIDWKPIFRGIERVRVRASRPRQMEGQALRIDTREEGIEFITTPKGPGGDTSGLKTSSFLRKFNCQAAVNAAFFGPMQGSEGRPVDVYGLQISRGEVVSNDGRNRHSLLITRDNRARIDSLPYENLDDVYNAVTGDSIVLEDGRVAGSRGDVHPRVCAGVSKDGRYVFLLAVDGRQGGWSDGATKKDLGNWLKRLGAWDGINLDGGGTAVMVIEENGRPQIINRPIHNQWPGNERVSGSHLGVRARPLGARG